MTIAQWFDENGIENLPILNICVCRGMKKEDYESHLFLQDSVFEIEFVNAQGLLDKKQFENSPPHSRDFSHELGGFFISPPCLLFSRVSFHESNFLS